MKKITVFLLSAILSVILFSANIYAAEPPMGVKQISVNLSIEDSGNGVVIGQGKYPINKPVRVEAIALEGNTFDGWYHKGELLSVEPVYFFEPTGDVSLVAKFSPSETKKQSAFSNALNYMVDNLFVTIMVFILLFGLLSLPFVFLGIRKAGAKNTSSEKILVSEMHRPDIVVVPETSSKPSPVLSRPKDNDL